MRMNWIGLLLSVIFGIVGIIAEIYPGKLLAFFLENRARIDFNDRSTWWIPRLIGVGFLFMALIMALINAGVVAR